jgi:general secretion pathway protein H
VFEKKSPDKQKQYGFTLLEVMLVFLLLGMIMMGVVMTLPGNTSSEESPQWQAQRFRTLMQIAEDEALISGMELGVVFAEDSYQFAFYDYQTKKWLPVVNKQLENKVELPESLTLTYLLAGSLWDEMETENQDEFLDEEERLVALTPQVYVMSSGEVTPFSVEFSATDNRIDEQPATVAVSMNGVISFPELP